VRSADRAGDITCVLSHCGLARSSGAQRQQLRTERPLVLCQHVARDRNLEYRSRGRSPGSDRRPVAQQSQIPGQFASWVGQGRVISRTRGP